jgi:hypothetical protein
MVFYKNLPKNKSLKKNFLPSVYLCILLDLIGMINYLLLAKLKTLRGRRFLQLFFIFFSGKRNLVSSAPSFLLRKNFHQGWILFRNLRLPGL